jgi:hypothetical protein
MKVISINGQRFALPADMSNKDVQALAGFLVTLQPVEQEYNYDSGEYMAYSTGSGAEVRVDNESTLISKAAAKQQHRDSYERYKVKRDSEQAA